MAIELFTVQFWSNKEEVWKVFYVSPFQHEAQDALDAVVHLPGYLYRLVVQTFDDLTFLDTHARDYRVIARA